MRTLRQQKGEESLNATQVAPLVLHPLLSIRREMVVSDDNESCGDGTTHGNDGMSEMSGETFRLVARVDRCFRRLSGKRQFGT
jgi:hypothetical protein